MTPDYGGIESSVTGINDALPHFRTFVTAVTERVATHLTKEKLCITGAKDMERGHSLLQFVYWPLDIHNEYIVPVLPVTGGFPGCKISSPWIDLIFVRTPVPFIQGIVRWNERQLLADQAALSGARNVPTGVAMPLSSYELGQFIGTYADTERSDPRAVKSLEERVPPDILWLLRRSPQTSVGRTSMRIARKEGAEGYTKLVLLLLDRCFAASNEKILHYNSIIDIDDPVLLEQYRIDMELY
ncbi:hypothetical protein AGMMS49545_14640 [Betaproteobacteria bacterium]|nr:hypothetical protein AGMMS49545_14640 [Betaproteobacteria bacterium]GHU41627.1 hypothetical protein AGMMS50289_05080 [Betaproteobacteria bacterium]